MRLIDQSELNMRLIDQSELNMRLTDHSQASFYVRVARAEGWSTLFNTPLLGSEPHPDREGWVVDVFETTPVMSTYTMALAIQDFASKPSSSGNMTIWAQEPYVSVRAVDHSQSIT